MVGVAIGWNRFETFVFRVDVLLKMANELELLGVILVNFLQIDQRIVYI